jgi:hypothetical protein
MRPLDTYIKTQLEGHLKRLEMILNADLLSIMSPIVYGLENLVRDAVEMKQQRRGTLSVILDTPGGVVEVVERMVGTIRHHYGEVIFIVPNIAMSAGTVFVMSGDRILMDYFSRLGPIDPQIEKDGKLVPALSYLNQFERLNLKAQNGQLTTAEYALLSKLDLGELHQFEQSRDLSRDLLVRWLSKYKFKDWLTKRTSQVAVTDEMRRQRAEEIATALADNERWHSHGRGIDMATLVNDLNLRIEDYGQNTQLAPAIKEYFELLRDYMSREKYTTFVHTSEWF